jgi:hypothetical protein
MDCDPKVGKLSPHKNELDCLTTPKLGITP